MVQPSNEKIAKPIYSKAEQAILAKSKEITQGDITIKDQKEDPLMAQAIDKKVRGGEEMVRVPNKEERWHFELPEIPQMSELWYPALTALGIGEEMERGYQAKIADLVESAVDLLGDEEPNPRKLFMYLSGRLGELGHLETSEKKMLTLLRLLKYELNDKMRKQKILKGGS